MSLAVLVGLRSMLADKHFPQCDHNFHHIENAQVGDCSICDGLGFLGIIISGAATQPEDDKINVVHQNQEWEFKN